MNNPKQEKEKADLKYSQNQRTLEEIYKEKARELDRDTAARMFEIDKKLFGHLDIMKKQN